MPEINTWPGWECVRQLGEGSFGKVYEIRRTEFGKEYRAALKVITIPQNKADLEDACSNGMDEQSATKYFKSVVEDITAEFALMSDLKGHSNIVSYEDHMVVEHENAIGWDILIRMELLTPLQAFCKSHVMDERLVIKLGCDICRALELCQKKNIIHRDIKPENMFVNDNGDYKLGDFGIARTMENASANLSAKKGTYNYMAPEVYLGQAYGLTADIYSLGMVLYRFLNENRIPFLPMSQLIHSDWQSALDLRMSGTQIPEPLHGSRRLKAAVLKAVAFEPKERFQTPEAFRKELERCMETAGEENADEGENGTVKANPFEQETNRQTEQERSRRNKATDGTIHESQFAAQGENRPGKADVSYGSQKAKRGSTAAVAVLLCVIALAAVLGIWGMPFLTAILHGDADGAAASAPAEIPGTDEKAAELPDAPADDFVQPSLPAAEPDTADPYQGNEDKAREISDYYAQISAGCNSGDYDSYCTDDGITSYWDGEVMVMITVPQGMNDYPYTRILCFLDGELYFAYYEGEDSYRFYFEQGELFRVVYCENARDTGSGSTYDNPDSYGSWSAELARQKSTLVDVAAAARDAVLYQPEPEKARENVVYADGISYRNSTFYISSGFGLAVFRDIVNGTNADLVKGWSDTKAPNGMSQIDGCLENDISLLDVCNIAMQSGEVSWVPIGSYGKGYFGTFDGNGYCISDFYSEYYTYDACYAGEDEDIPGGAGLFAMNDGVIKNLALSGSVETHIRRTGGLVGINHGVISHCVIKVSLFSDTQYLGGIAGVNDGQTDSVIEYCACFGSITNIYESSSSNTESSGLKTGGITGGNWSNGYVDSCYYKGNISVDSYGYVGGIAGKMANKDSIYRSWYPEYCCNEGDGLENLSDYSFSVEEGQVHSGEALDILASDEWVMGKYYPELKKCPIPEHFYDF